MFSESDILSALRTVIEPDLRKDLVSLNMIRDIIIGNNSVSFTIVLTTPACPLKEKIEKDCIEAIHQYVNNSIDVKVNMTSNVNTARTEKLVLPGVRNIIAVASGKGGVGKSTVAANLALGLAMQGAKTGLLDADIHGPSVPIMFGITEEKPMMQNVNGKEMIAPVEKFGVKLLSIGLLVKPGQAVVWRGPMVSSALRQFVNDANWGELDYLILDLPPGTGDIHLTMTQVLPLTGAVIVTTPQEVAVSDAMKALDMFNVPGINVPVLGIIENMSWFEPAELPGHKYFIFGKGGGEKLAELANAPLLGQIPLVQSIRESGDNGTPAVYQDSGPVAEAFKKVIGNLAREVAVKNIGNMQQA